MFQSIQSVYCESHGCFSEITPDRTENLVQIHNKSTAAKEYIMKQKVEYFRKNTTKSTDTTNHHWVLTTSGI